MVFSADIAYIIDSIKNQANKQNENLLEAIVKFVNEEQANRGKTAKIRRI